MPFLEILTRTIPTRPYYLKRCQESVTFLKDPDWTQRIIMDEEIHGVEWANENMKSIEAVGDWVWVLDDDDVCCYYELIGDLRKLAAKENPDLVILRAYHAQWGMLPPHEAWGLRPILGRIGPSNVIVRREVWNNHRGAWTPTYAGDFWFINALWDSTRPRGPLKLAWLPVIGAYQTQQNAGKGDP